MVHELNYIIYNKNIRVTIQICHKTLEGILTAKLTSDNTNKMIISQDFGEIYYSNYFLKSSYQNKHKTTTTKIIIFFFLI